MTTLITTEIISKTIEILQISNSDFVMDSPVK